MQLFLKNTSGQVSALRLSGDVASTTVGSLRAQAGIADGCQLVCGSSYLSHNSCTLAECGVVDSCTIHVLLPLDGGKGKKKKKRIFTKPKKPNHKHKLQKMRALKYFKVTENDDGSYKVERTRQECPHPQCGAGVFMAQHKDRQYCGKCHLTYQAEKK